MNIDWNSIAASAVSAMVIGIFQLAALRYAGRALDRVERGINQLKRNGKGKESN